MPISRDPLSGFDGDTTRISAPPPMPDAPPAGLKVDLSEGVSTKNRNRRDVSLLDLAPESLDPKLHYRWVRCRSDEYLQAVTKRRLEGYELVPADGTVKTVVQPDKRPDNVIAIGDLVLMACPQDLHRERQETKRARSEGLLMSTAAETKRAAKEKGVRIIEDTD